MTMELTTSFKGEWNADTTYQLGVVVWHNGQAWSSDTTTNLGNEPGVDPGWTQVSTSGGGGGGLSVWTTLTPYSTGDLVLDRGGTWQATAPNTSSEPVSGNADWTLVGGTPYTSTLLDPTALTTAPVVDLDLSGPGYVLVPAPGAGLIALPRRWLFQLTTGDQWSFGGTGFVSYQNKLVDAVSLTAQDPGEFLSGSQPTPAFVPSPNITVGKGMVPAPQINEALVFALNDLPAGGTSSFEIIQWYDIVSTP